MEEKNWFFIHWSSSWCDVNGKIVQHFSFINNRSLSIKSLTRWPLGQASHTWHNWWEKSHLFNWKTSSFNRQHMGVRYFYISAVIYLFYLGNLTLYMLCIQHLYLLNSARPVIPTRQVRNPLKPFPDLPACIYIYSFTMDRLELYHVSSSFRMCVSLLA